MERSVHKKQPVTGILVVMTCALFIAAAPAGAAKVTAFTAELVTIPADGSAEIKGNLYYTPDSMRMEMNLPGGAGTMTVLYLKQDQKMIMINPRATSYFEMPLQEDQWPGLNEDAELERKKLGTEQVGGYECTKYEVVRNVAGFTGQARQARVIYWESEKFAFPLRTRLDDGTVQELRNIKKGAPPASVFKVPAGYKKAANMMQLMMPQ